MTRDRMIMLTQMGIAALDDGNAPWLPATPEGQQGSTPIYHRLRREIFQREMMAMYGPRRQVRRW